MSQGTWGVAGLPSYVNMYIYVPDRLATRPPILVASHHCQGTGPGTYDETKSSLVPLADSNGFIIIFPEATGRNCWDVGTTKSLTHDGGGDTHAIAQMARYTMATYSADESRIYAFGGSSGAMMTEALMGVYPDLFRAGVAVSGVPCGCWAVGYSGDTGADPEWSGPCAGGTVIKTGQEWGDLVRATFPGYTGRRPRLQLWHGTADTLVSFENQGEAVKEWTNILDLTETPSSTDTNTPGYTHAIWNGACGDVRLETWDAQGVGHGVNWDTSVVAGFLGIDDPVSDPGAAACEAGGVSGAGGAGDGGAAPNAGGAEGVGGAGAGGFASLGGKVGASGGSGGTAGASGSAGGALPVGSGGPGSSGASGIPGPTTTDAGSPHAAAQSDDAASGCNCALGGAGNGPAGSATFVLSSLGLLLGGRRRPPRHGGLACRSERA